MSKLFFAIALGFLIAGSVSAQEWTTAVSKHKTEDRTIVYRFASKFAPGFERSTQPNRITIAWRYESEGGMPSTEERQRMDMLEDKLSPSIEIDGFGTLAIVSTGENMREWVYYAKSEEEFMARLNSALDGLHPFPIEIDATQDADWGMYESFRSGLVDADG